ncbi:mitochondrial fission ELM1 family protein [Acetobacteraceae bacterium H6797]|nr:mitochondrial fission ELM1 family protein [Acetobacteraceae bacterium H6797]
MTKGGKETRVLVLADPRAGTAAQALGIAERLGVPFEVLPLEWGAGARIPWPWPSLLGLTPAARARVRAAGKPDLVIAAGRRAAPVARWFGRRGARLVQAMRPGFGASAFDLLVLPRHDEAGEGQNVITILGATHRLSPARLAKGREAWAAELGALPGPRIAMLVGGAVKGEPMSEAAIRAMAEGAIALAGQGDGPGSIMATTSRRTGEAATKLLADALAAAPLGGYRLFRWGDAGPNPYDGFLAWADAIVVTGESVSMLSEAVAAGVPVFIAPAGGGRRHARLVQGLIEAGRARMLGSAEGLPAPLPPLDESGRVATQIITRGWLG